MLTVLTRYRKTHIEYVTQAETVEYFPMLQPDQPPDIKILATPSGDGNYSQHCMETAKYNLESAGLLLHRQSGPMLLNFTPQNSVPADENLRDVFVMNEGGATVAKYTL